MSHITKRKSAMRDLPAIKEACKAMGAKYNGIVTMGRGVTGRSVQVKFKDWHYPVNINCATGACSFDNYGGRWGKESVLDQLKQSYGVEAARSLAATEGCEFATEKLEGGAIKCTVTIGGESDYGVDGGETADGYGL